MTALCIPLLAAALSLPAPGASAKILILTGARVLDPGGERWLEGRVVVVRDGRIERIARSS